VAVEKYCLLAALFDVIHLSTFASFGFIFTQIIRFQLFSLHLFLFHISGLSVSVYSPLSREYIKKHPRHTSMSAGPSTPPRYDLPQVAVHTHRSIGGFFNPTHLEFSDLSKTPSSNPVVWWNSRQARKGRVAPKQVGVYWLHRHSSVIGAGTEAGSGDRAGEKGHAQLHSKVLEGRVRHRDSHTKPGWRSDISFWLAVTFTFGSALWVVNGESFGCPRGQPRGEKFDCYMLICNQDS
jgi:hypothetical protein